MPKSLSHLEPYGRSSLHVSTPIFLDFSFIRPGMVASFGLLSPGVVDSYTVRCSGVSDMPHEPHRRHLRMLMSSCLSRPSAKQYLFEISASPPPFELILIKRKWFFKVGPKCHRVAGVLYYSFSL